MNPEGYTMIANPFVEVGTGELIGIADMFSDDTENAIGGTSISASDNIQVWNGEAYHTYYLRENKKAGTKFWVDPEVSGTTETPATLPEHGGAFYISRATSVNPTTLTISGEVRTTDETVSIAPGYNLLENPFPTELSLTNFINGAVGGTSISASDNIQVWSGEAYHTYYLRENKKTGTKFWVDPEVSGTTATTDTIAPFTSFFYLSRGNASFDVVLPCPL